MKSILNTKLSEKYCRCTVLCNKFQPCLVLYTCLNQLFGVKGHQKKMLLLVIFVVFDLGFYKNMRVERKPHFPSLTFRFNLIQKT